AFFAKLTRDRLRRGVFKGIVDLQAAINRYSPKPTPTPSPSRGPPIPTRLLRRYDAIMPSMLPFCSPAAARLAARSNTTAGGQGRGRKDTRIPSPLISPGHLPPWETGVRVDPLAPAVPAERHVRSS